jgi:hypothetical protein
MARNNYKSEKRRKELERIKKREKKEQRRLEKKSTDELGRENVEPADQNESSED